MPEKKILLSRAKSSKEKRMIEQCDIETDVEYMMVGIVKISVVLEERFLGDSGQEEIDQSIEELIWNTKMDKEVRLNKLFYGE
jgi:hypothetical protein